MTHEQIRERQAQAQQMWRDGGSIKDISKKLRMDVKTVRSYVREVEADFPIPDPKPIVRDWVTPREIEDFRQSCKPGMWVKAPRNVYTEILGVYSNFARTKKGCYKWADLVLASRGGAHEAENTQLCRV